MKLPDLIIRKLHRDMLAVMSSRLPDVIIGDDGSPYMERWHVIPRNQNFNIYLHNFLRSDKTVLHDHPAAGFSIILLGEYIEVNFANPGEYVKGYTNATSEPVCLRHLYTRGDVIFRRAVTPHRIQLLNEPPNPPVITMWITGPKLRDWGFYCPQRWKQWQEFGAYETAGRQGCGD